SGCRRGLRRRMRSAGRGERCCEPRVGRAVKGRTALVTGGSRGIGRAIVVELARRGAIVRFSYLQDEAAAAAAVAAAREAGGEAAGTRVDGRDRGQVREWIRAVSGETGGLHILVNNAGIRRDG